MQIAMKESSGYNVVVLGVSCFDGMASSMRIRNLIEPLVEKCLIKVFNLIYIKEYKENKTSEKGTTNGISYQVIHFRPSNIFSIISFLFRGMRVLLHAKSKNSKNILYTYDYPDAKNILLLFFAKMIGYKIIFDIIEDNSFITRYSSLLFKFRMMTSKFLIKQSPSIASAYLAISSHLYNKMKTLSKGKVPVYFIPVTVNFKYFKNGSHKNGSTVDGRQTTVDGNGYKKLEKKIFYGGSFGNKDGLPYLINAFDELCNRHNNLSLILTGKGIPADMQDIFDKISQLKCKDKIIYKGFLDTHEYYEVLNDCDIFCMTRVNSKFANAGFPFKLGEFLATGKGVIATKIGDIPEYLVNKQNALLIEPESVPQLVDAVDYMLQNPEKLNDLGVASRQTARKYFDSEKLSMQLFEVFKTS
jgi:glycosyltransferase involved in cell wall biosynthesis